MKRMILKVSVLLVLLMNLAACSIWDWESGHTEEDSKKVVNEQLTDKDIENINEMTKEKDKKDNE